MAWESLSVKEFIRDCNWQGWSPEILSELANLSESVDRLKQSLIGWESLTTQAFFDSNNWNGLSILPNNVDRSITIEQNAVFSLTLPNSQFWQCFSWLGSVDLPSDKISSESVEVNEATKEFTITDLSQLF